MRIAGLVYVAYFSLAILGTATSSRALSVIGTGVYFVLAIFLYRLFAGGDPRVALAFLPAVALGCVLQSIGMIQADRETQRLALVFFGLSLVVLGYLMGRSGLAPAPLAYWIALAGVGWCAVMIPALPNPLLLGLQFFGAAAEVALAIWLLLRG